jgi:hypothetical protein
MEWMWIWRVAGRWRGVCLRAMTVGGVFVDGVRWWLRRGIVCSVRRRRGIRGGGDRRGEMGVVLMFN